MAYRHVVFAAIILLSLVFAAGCAGRVELKIESKTAKEKPQVLIPGGPPPVHVPEERIDVLPGRRVEIKPAGDGFINSTRDDHPKDLPPSESGDEEYEEVLRIGPNGKIFRIGWRLKQRPQGVIP